MMTNEELARHLRDDHKAEIANLIFPPQLMRDHERLHAHEIRFMDDREHQHPTSPDTARGEELLEEPVFLPGAGVAERQVYILVTHRGGEQTSYPVPKDGGWRLRASTQELTIGRGVPRVHVPLFNVLCYEVKETGA